MHGVIDLPSSSLAFIFQRLLMSSFFFFFFPFFGSDILIHSCWEEAVLLSFLSVSYLKSNNQVPRKLVADCLGLGSI